jgi:hypothetical protein
LRGRVIMGEIIFVNNIRKYIIHLFDNKIISKPEYLKLLSEKTNKIYLSQKKK